MLLVPDILALIVSLVNAIMIRVRVEGFENVVCHGHDDSVHIQPVVQPIVLLLVEGADFFVLDRFKLIVALPEVFELVPIDTVEQCLLQFLAPRILESCVGCVPEAPHLRSWLGVAILLVPIAIAIAVLMQSTLQVTT